MGGRAIRPTNTSATNFPSFSTDIPFRKTICSLADNAQESFADRLPTIALLFWLQCADEKFLNFRPVYRTGSDPNADRR